MEREPKTVEWDAEAAEKASLVISESIKAKKALRDLEQKKLVDCRIIED